MFLVDGGWRGRKKPSGEGRSRQVGFRYLCLRPYCLLRDRLVTSNESVRIHETRRADLNRTDPPSAAECSFEDPNPSTRTISSQNNQLERTTNFIPKSKEQRTNNTVEPLENASTCLILSNTLPRQQPALAPSMHLSSMEGVGVQLGLSQDQEKE